MSAVYSMTGFASLRGSAGDGLAFTLTLKSVNHRFLDLSFRLPSYCDGLEMQLRKSMKESLRRGHVDVTLQVERRANVEIQLNSDLLGAYVKAFREGAKTHGIVSEPDLSAMLRIPGVMSVEASTGAGGHVGTGGCGGGADSSAGGEAE